MIVNKKILLKTTSLVISSVMLISLAACGKTDEITEKPEDNKEAVIEYTEAAESVIKNETVYVNIDNTGKVKEIQVTDWLHTDKPEVYIDDLSDLKNIENIKTDNNPVIDGESVKWNMPDTDLYYSGTTDKKLPVDISLKYSIDGKELTPKQIAGKDGKLKIDIEMKNNAYKTVKINGSEQKIFLPVMVVGGMILSESKFSGIDVENGRAIGDGTKEIVAFYGMPGLSESLGIGDLGITDIEGLVIGSKASVTADVKDFELGNIYFAVLPIASLNIDLSSGDSVNDLKSVLGALSQIQASLSTLDTEKLMDMLTNNSDSVNSLMTVVSDAIELYQSNRALIDVLTKYATPENADQIKELLEFLSSSDTAKALSMLTDSTVIKFFNNLSKLNSSMPLVSGITKDLQSPEVQKAIENLPETLEKISEIQKTISNNSEAIDAVVSLLSDDSMDTIQNVMSLIGSADFASLAEKYSALATNADDIVARAEKWIAYGREYKVFTNAAENMDTSLMFIYMTPEINNVKTASDTQTTEATTSFIDSFIKKFK